MAPGLAIRQLQRAGSEYLRRTAEYDARALVEPRERKVEDVATDIVKVNVEISDCLLEVAVERWALVVERLVNAEILLKPLALVVGSGDRDDLGTQLLSNLAHDRSCRTRCTGDNQRLSGLELANIEEALAPMSGTKVDIGNVRQHARSMLSSLRGTVSVHNGYLGEGNIPVVPSGPM